MDLAVDVFCLFLLLDDFVGLSIMIRVFDRAALFSGLSLFLKICFGVIGSEEFGRRYILPVFLALLSALLRSSNLVFV